MKVLEYPLENLHNSRNESGLENPQAKNINLTSKSIN